MKYGVYTYVQNTAFLVIETFKLSPLLFILLNHQAGKVKNIESLKLLAQRCKSDSRSDSSWEFLRPVIWSG
jgi:hypothetical protein